MAQTLFTNVMVFDGGSKRSFAGEVLVQGNMIKKVTKRGQKIKAPGAKVVDGCGTTLMPGLIEPHAHVTYTDCPSLPDVGRVPPEEHMMIALRNAKTMLDQGFTALYSAAGVSKIRLEVALRNAINDGHFPGPRLRASSPEITSTGGLGDERLLHLHQESIGLIADGVDEMMRGVRICAREGVDNIKINISGDAFARGAGMDSLAYTDAEVAACMQVANERGLKVATHARSDESIRMALRHNIDVLYHADLITMKTVDLIEARKKRIFMAPAAGLIYTTIYEASDWGITEQAAESMNLKRKLESCMKVYAEFRKRGIRALPGGDYGFAWNPIGTNARDLEHFVNLFGYSPAEALKGATKWGGELMEMNIGQVKEGYLADLLLVDGDPLKDVSILQDADNLLMIMKDGAYHKAPDGRKLARRRQVGAAAAE
jgi:imidazolonepropionase-like amidohydrolase